MGPNVIFNTEGERMKNFRGSAVVAGLSVVALTLAGCAATEELTPTSSPSAVAEEATIAPLITVAWNDIVDTFNSSSAAGNNVANSLTTYLTSSTFNYYDNSPALVQNTEFGSYEVVSEEPLTVT